MFSPFVDRTLYNEVVVQAYDVKVATLLDAWLLQKCKLLGHLFRANLEDPLRQAIF